MSELQEVNAESQFRFQELVPRVFLSRLKWTFVSVTSVIVLV